MCLQYKGDLVHFEVSANSGTTVFTRTVKAVPSPRGSFGGLSPGMHNLFAIAGRITFIFMNYGRQFTSRCFYFVSIASVSQR